MENMSTCDRIKMVLADVTGKDIAEIQDSSSFMDDIGMESIEVYDLLVELEVEFSIKIPEKVLRRVFTIKDMGEAIEEIIRGN